jgi:hypothetical protein
MIGTHFYNETIKTAVAVFGSLFNNIVIKRRDGKLLPVPISYGPRQKWLDAQKQFQPSEEMFEKLLPRMSYEIVAMNYDTTRKLTNRQTMIREPDGIRDPRQRINVPTPYNLDFSLYTTTKTLSDGWQIIEQILPFFTPAYTVKVRHFPQDSSASTPTPTNTYDQQFTLLATTWADDYTGELGDRRTIEWSMEFQTKIWMHGPVANTTVIYDSRAIVSVPPTGVSIHQMSRATNQQGEEVGYAVLSGNSRGYDSDSKGNYVLDSDGVSYRLFDSDLDTYIDSDSTNSKKRFRRNVVNDSEILYSNDSDRSPTILNLSDSDGNVIRIIRNLPEN